MTIFEFEFSARLDALLNQEKQALLNAQFTDLPKILEEKIQLISLLEKAPANEEALHELKTKILQNQVLLDEAMAAIRSTAQRIADLRISRRSVSTYNHMGQKRTLQPDADISVEKKA